MHSVSTSCWYCSDETVNGYVDKEFASNVSWDIPILEGYPYRFFKNYSWKPSLYRGFFGLFNPGMLTALFRESESIIIVHGWGYLTNILVLLVGRIAGHQVCLRAETPLNQELAKGARNKFFKKIFLQCFLFIFVKRFLYIGSQNKFFYQYFGVPPAKMIFTPYAVDNDRFQKASLEFAAKKNQLRTEFGITVNSKVILFSGKYIPKKRPIDLLKAYSELDCQDKCLVMVGDGELRKDMEIFIKDNDLSNVFLTGFINQTEIAKYYSIADVFVMCSESGETWGLSVNEAMNFQLPIVVSDMTGCSNDLVDSGKNGFISQTGNVESLTKAIDAALALEGKIGLEKIDVFSFRTIAQSLKNSFQTNR